jgi:hypothetical protein
MVTYYISQSTVAITFRDQQHLSTVFIVNARPVTVYCFHSKNPRQPNKHFHVFVIGTTLCNLLSHIVMQRYNRHLKQLAV